MASKTKDDDTQAIVLRRFLRNGVTYDPAGPNDRCSDFVPGEDPKTGKPKDEAFALPNPLLILPSRLKNLTVGEALEQQIHTKTIQELEERATEAEKGRLEAEARYQEMEQVAADLKARNDALTTENRNLTDKIAKAASTPAS